MYRLYTQYCHTCIVDTAINSPRFSPVPRVNPGGDCRHPVLFWFTGTIEIISKLMGGITIILNVGTYKDDEYILERK